MEIVLNIPNSAVGVVPCADISVLEVCFANREAQQDFLSSPFKCKHFTSHPVPPAGMPSLYVPIKLMNIPSFGLTCGRNSTPLFLGHPWRGNRYCSSHLQGNTTPIQPLGSCSQT